MEGVLEQLPVVLAETVVESGISAVTFEEIGSVVTGSDEFVVTA
jgi:hypothetical protein